MFCVFNGTLHVAWFTVVFDADEDLWAGGGHVIAGLYVGDSSEGYF